MTSRESSHMHSRRPGLTWQPCRCFGTKRDDLHSPASSRDSVQSTSQVESGRRLPVQSVVVCLTCSRRVGGLAVGWVRLANPCT
ncbi:MAG: DUF1589 domain-containing protein [Rhodopirellula sp. JB055]|uniref:DUF1589 domain-containing protein n=1 Tax=Rhodopirellula sp. JB055 TaxID=3342846 RepID=UPI003709F723